MQRPPPCPQLLALPGYYYCGLATSSHAYHQQGISSRVPMAPLTVTNPKERRVLKMLSPVRPNTYRYRYRCDTEHRDKRTDKVPQEEATDEPDTSRVTSLSDTVDLASILIMIPRPNDIPGCRRPWPTAFREMISAARHHPLLPPCAQNREYIGLIGHAQ